MALSPNAAAVQWGPGKLYAAPLGTAEPAELTTAWDVAWLRLGYTADGSSQVSTPTINDIEVAEELEPIARIPTKIVRTIKFACAEMTAVNLQRAFNGGTITPLPSAVAPTSYRFDPPALGDQTRIMLGWDSDDGLERWLWRRTFQTGTTTIVRKKGTLTSIDMEWTIEKPGGTVLPFSVFYDVSLSGLAAAA